MAAALCHLLTLHLCLSPRTVSSRPQELVNFPRPELPPHIHEAFLRAAQETPILPEATPNPSLPEHMKPRPNQGKSMHGRQRAPLQHR